MQQVMNVCILIDSKSILLGIMQPYCIFKDGNDDKIEMGEYIPLAKRDMMNTALYNHYSDYYFFLSTSIGI